MAGWGGRSGGVRSEEGCEALTRSRCPSPHPSPRHYSPSLSVSITPLPSFAESAKSLGLLQEEVDALREDLRRAQVELRETEARMQARGGEMRGGLVREGGGVRCGRETEARMQARGGEVAKGMK